MSRRTVDVWLGRCYTVATKGGKRRGTKRPKPLLIWLGTWYRRDVVAHTGVEPVISALRGRRPGPLDECAMLL